MLRQRPTTSGPSPSFIDKEVENATAIQTDPRTPLLQPRASSSRPSISFSASSAVPFTISALSQSKGEREGKPNMGFKDLSRKSQWIALAVMSGGCAAFNGVFAKLTTTDLTTNFATSIAAFLGLRDGEKVVEVIIRGIFFALNLIFNGIMWGLFTKALARGTSTTQVSIINTSSNFMVTAILGFLIFSESLPPLWFLGAAFLVAGNVIIGRREEKDILSRPTDEGTVAEESEGLLVNEELELDDDIEGLGRKVREREEEDVLQVNFEDEEDSDMLDMRD